MLSKIFLKITTIIYITVATRRGKYDGDRDSFLLINNAFHFRVHYDGIFWAKCVGVYGDFDNFSKCCTGEQLRNTLILRRP